MKRIIAFLLAFILAFCQIGIGLTDQPATPTDLEPAPPIVEIQTSDFAPSLSNMRQFSIIALNDFTQQGHVRGSVWVGGTMTGGPYMYVDDAAGASSYVYDNKSSVEFKGRTSEQSPDAYTALSDTAVTNAKNYWWTVYRNLGTNNETCIYVPASSDGVAHITPAYGFPRYVCEGDDTSHGGSPVTYWTDAKTVEVQDICGFIIAPGSTINLSGNNRISVVGSTVHMNWAEIHINDDNPITIEPTPTPTPVPTPTPTPIIVTKELKGEIWHLRCDTMDNTTFTAGGGRWYADITNWENKTSKEGHRSNHCGDANNWVLFVGEDGKAVALYQLKSGSTGGTLPSIVYRAPSDLASIPEGQLIYDPTDPNDAMTQRLINEVFRPENAMPFSEIQLVAGKRLFWISQNGNQVWHHTGVLSGPERPRFTIVINGVAYALGVGESVEIAIVEEGLLEIDEIATANYKLQAVEDNGDGKITIINEIDPPNKPTPTPPPSIVTPTPTPTPTGETPTPTPTSTLTSPPVDVTPSPTPTATPTDSPTPSPTPVSYCSITIQKAVDQYEYMDSAIFYFKITGVGLDEPLYVEISVDPKTGTGSETITGLKAGKYTVEEVDVPDGYILISDGSITRYYKDDGGSVQFENQFVTPTPSLTPSPSPTPTTTITESPSPTPEQTTPPPVETTQPPEETATPTISPTPATPTDLTPIPGPSEEPSESPSPTPTLSPTPSPTPTATPTPTPQDTPLPTLTPEPLPSVTPTPVPYEEPEIETTTVGIRKRWNDAGYTVIRPKLAYIRLYGDGQYILTATLSDENDWFIIYEVPKYNEQGNEIQYEWKEVEVPGYHVESTYDIDIVTTIINRVYEIPQIPPGQKPPKLPGKPVAVVEIEDYKTALGIGVTINHVGDCFD